MKYHIKFLLWYSRKNLGSFQNLVVLPKFRCRNSYCRFSSKPVINQEQLEDTKDNGGIATNRTQGKDPAG